LYCLRKAGGQTGLANSRINASEVEGTSDFTLTYSFSVGLALPVRAAVDGGAAGGAVGAAAPAVAAASDPTGAITIFQALEKQLGMKLDLQKRPIPVYCDRPHRAETHGKLSARPWRC
jgi:uncharacterized protein (TIGR03435 family)